MFSVKKLSGCIGAELSGVDLTSDLEKSVLDEIERLLLDHEVIFFRDQDISWQQHKEIAEHFGSLQSHPAYSSPDGYPEITILESTAEKPTKIESWHTDMTFLKSPPLCSILRSKICPPKGGDTMWSSMNGAYENLSPAMQSFLSDKTAEHDFSYGFKESIAEPGGRKRLKDAIAIASLSLLRPPGSAILSLKPYEKSCSAVLSLRKDCIAGDRFSYAPFILDHIVSPPFGGHIFDLRIEHKGGLFRKVISVCHDSIFVGFSAVLSRIVISG